MIDTTNNEIIALLGSEPRKLVQHYFADEIGKVARLGDPGAPELDEIIDMVSVGQLGLGGVEYVEFKTRLEQAVQGDRRAEAFADQLAANLKRWVVEQGEFLAGLIKGELADTGVETDIDRVRGLAGIIEGKQDVFPPMLVAIYVLGPGFDDIREFM